jgi:hypothetical protein
MTNVYDFLKYQPETYKQFACKDLLIAYFDCPQFRHREEVFSHYSYLTFVVREEASAFTGRGRPGRLKKGVWSLLKKAVLSRKCI